MARSRIRRLGRALGVVLAATVVVAGAVALVWAAVMPRLTATASGLDEVDLTLGSAAATRAATAQAVVFAVGSAGGDVTDEALTAALGEAAANLDAYDQLVAALASGGAGVDTGSLAPLSTNGRAVLGLLDAGEVDPARELAQADFEAAYGEAVAELGEARNDLLGELETVGRWTETAGYASRLAVTLLIPMLAIAVFWWMAGQRIAVHRRRAQLQVEEEAARVREKDELLAKVSHRFRTPLTSIYGLSDVLVKKDLRGLDRELAALINSEAGELYRMAEDVSAAAQLEAGMMRASSDIVALAGVVEEAVKPLRAAGTEIEVECPEVWVVTDSDKVAHILRNLLANAAAYGRGAILVEVSEIDGVVQCVVIDHGDGLPAGHWADTDQPHTIEDGFTEAEGIGLKVAYSLARLIGARLEHFRIDGQTRFGLSFAEEGDVESARRTGRRAIIRRLPRPIQRKTPEPA